MPWDPEWTAVGELARHRSRACELPGGTRLVEGIGAHIRIPDEAVEQARPVLDSWKVVPD